MRQPRHPWLPLLSATVLFMVFGLARTAAAAPVDETRAAHEQTTVTIKVVAGDVEVTGWKRAAIRLSGDLWPKWSFEVSDDGKQAVVDLGPGGKGGVHVHIPVGASVFVKSNHGKVDVQGVKGSVGVKTMDGDIKIRGTPVDVEVKTINGRVEVHGRVPRAAINSVSSDVHVVGPSGSVAVRSVSGAVTIDEASVTRATVNSTSGAVSFSGRLEKGPHEFAGHSGDIVLTLPPKQRGTFVISTFSGAIRNELGGTETHRGRVRKITIGTGGPEIAIRSFSGNVTLKKKR